ncbi:AAA family ATPase [Mycobacterium sp. ITM-2016-00318]|uniref:AAA family ATPase n=1 Tax=Mycobacterium sp. ITM-2016-00318 TaxID=2099693 RepID=UPI001E399D36|nr:AAA family ATPase [Mycobacterium sp. ITM-2016-00318]WNG95296.1 AAA family ATPase [Mycobacterium sp. ITM-2016-00318]
MLDGTIDSPTPEICRRDDGIGLFYRGQVNVVFGDSEAGKTMLCDFGTVQVLNDGGNVLRLDLDHNGPDATVARLLALGASTTVLRDDSRFLYTEPDDALHLTRIVAHMATWLPTFVVLDSIGELMPLYKANSNSADEFTAVHRSVIKALAKTGAAVAAIDHISKGAESRSYGATGTAAKKRAAGGSSLRVSVDKPFTPGKGGSAWITIQKDRHGGLRQESPASDKEPVAGKFVMEVDGDVTRAYIRPPEPGTRNPAEIAPPDDVAAVEALDPHPKSARDARRRLAWRDERARKAYKTWYQEKNT